MTSEVFKLKGLSEQVINDFIRNSKEKPEVHLAKEAAEKAEREAVEKVAVEAATREATKKVVTKAATREKAEVEAALAVETAQKAAEDVAKTTELHKE